MQIFRVPLLAFCALQLVLCDEPLDQSVTMRADNEVALAEANALTSRVSFGEATLHELVGKADDFLEGAEDAYELARDTVPMSKQAATRAKVYAYNTEKARKDAQGVISEMKKIAPSAASAAAKTIMAQLKQESIAEAEKKGAADAANWAATKDKMKVGAVAGAATIYHLALMRAQKSCVEYKTRADSSIEGAKKVVDAAQQAATTSQVLQAGGKFVEAREYMMNAHAMMNEAVKMQGWANKFQATAGKVCGSVTNGVNGFAEQMGMAASNMNAIWSTDNPMSLPGALLQKDSRDSTSKASEISKSSLIEQSAFATVQDKEFQNSHEDDLAVFQKMMGNYKTMTAKADELQEKYKTFKEQSLKMSAK